MTRTNRHNEGLMCLSGERMQSQNTGKTARGGGWAEAAKIQFEMDGTGSVGETARATRDDEF